MAFDAGDAVRSPAPGRKTTLADWAPLLADPRQRATLGRALAPLLTQDVTARLPAELSFDQATGDIDHWIDTADGLADIYTITRNDTEALAGLLLLFSPDGPGGAEISLGYFLGHEHRGKGLASDMLAGLVAQLDQGPPRRLFAGTDADNPASQRVLEKAGFTRIHDDTVPGRVAFTRHCGG